MTDREVESIVWTSRRILGSLALGLLICSSLIGLSRCDRGQSSQAAPGSAPLPQDPDIQIYFNQNPAARYREIDRPIERPGDNLEQILLDRINQANKRIDLALYELRLPRIAQALATKHRAGVQVRIVIDNDNNRTVRELASDLPATSRDALKDATQNAIAEDSAPRPPKFDYARQHYEGLAALVDQDGDGQLSDAETAEKDAIAILRRAGVPLLDEAEQTSRRRLAPGEKSQSSKGSSLMHHKFVIIDQHHVLTGSANVTPSDIHGDLSEPESRGNANHLLAIESQALAQIFETEFEQLWGDGPEGKKDSQFGQRKTPRSAQVLQIGQSKLTVQFGPRAKADRAKFGHGNQLIADQLKRANRRIDLALFVFSEPSLTRSLARQHTNGIAIQALIDRNFAFRPYSQALPMLGLASACGTWSHPLDRVGVPNLPPGDRLHHKLALIDDRILITGSHNWSFAADRRNDETLLVIDNPRVATHVRRELDRLYSNATFGLPRRFQPGQPGQQPQPTVKTPLDCTADR